MDVGQRILDDGDACWTHQRHASGETAVNWLTNVSNTTKYLLVGSRAKDQQACMAQSIHTSSLDANNGGSIIKQAHIV
jgi:hypothetical protein